MKKTHPILRDIESVKPYKTVDSSVLYKVRPPIMTIEDFLPAAGVMGLTAQPGVGKTWAAMEVCRSVGKGALFLGKFKTIRGGVLFIGNDSSLYDYARQWKRLTQDEPDHDAFDPVRFLIQENFLFEDTDEVRRLIATHRKFAWGETTFGEGNLPERNRGFHVIVFDTLSALTNVPESDNTGRELVFRHIRLIAEATDCAVIVLHHNAARSEFNDGEGFRGATSQRGRLDSQINLVPSFKDEYLIGVTYKKFRGIKPQNFSYRMDVNDPLTAMLSFHEYTKTREQKMATDTLAEHIFEYVKLHPNSTAPTIRQALAPRFEQGVAGVDGKTTTFAPNKMVNGVNNRLAGLCRKSRLVKDVDNEGKITYRVAEPQSHEAGATAQP